MATLGMTPLSNKVLPFGLKRQQHTFYYCNFELIVSGSLSYAEMVSYILIIPENFSRVQRSYWNFSPDTVHGTNNASSSFFTIFASFTDVKNIICCKITTFL